MRVRASAPPTCVYAVRWQTERDGTLPTQALENEHVHACIEKADAIGMGYEVTKNNYCAYKFCKHAEANKKMKCGVGQKYEEDARSKAPCFCIHPKCLKGYHPTCHALAHKQIA